MLKTLAGLVAELRAVGIPVSPTEHIDAAAALGHTALEDRSAVKAALAATLVKDAQHWPAFATVFDLYFAGRRRDIRIPGMSEEDSSTEGEDEGEGHRAGGVLAGLSNEELAELLYRAIRDGDQVILRAIAGELVTRFSGIEMGRRVAGTYYLFKALRPMNLEGILQRLRDEQANQSPLDSRLAALDFAGRVDAFRGEVESEIRERMVADRGPEDVARTLRHPLPEDIDFLNATRSDAAAIREALKPLARKLAARLARKRRSRRDAPLDFRQTMRRSLSTGGVPVDLVFRKPHPSRPELIVIADVSGSVATFANFTLQLVYALRSEFARVRCFVFVDGIDEVTELMEKADNLAEVTHHINRGSAAVWLSGRSDYGHALRTFERRWGDQVRSRSTVIVLGDARNNYLHPREESLAAVAERARAVYWLNPERTAMWNDGDSVIGRYAQHCDGVYECRNVRQLKQFVEQLEP
jgi:uncharacterized protein with von Willebrand factor type A (vWA) domain